MPDQNLNSGLENALDLIAPLAERFNNSGHRLYLVGGVVRDSLLGIVRTDNDLDATTDALPAEIKEIVSEVADAVWTQGERFGTIGCRIAGHIYEITTHRAESYDPSSRKPAVSFGDRLDDDLSRRDFTINSMAVDARERTVIDLFGGEADLRNRILRTPLDATISFSDDPLRMLRAARFRAAFQLEPVKELSDAVAQMADRIDIVSAERIRIELEKLLLLDQPGPGLEMLRTTGLLARVLPELAGFDQQKLSDLAARVAAVDPLIVHRWAALLSDPETAAGRLRHLKTAGAVIVDTQLLLSIANQIGSESGSSDIDVRRMAMMGNGRIRLEEVIVWLRNTARASDLAVAHLDELDETLDRLRNSEPDLDKPEPVIDGNRICELLDIEPGVEVGRVVDWLREIRLTRGRLPVDQLEAELVEWWHSTEPPRP